MPRGGGFFSREQEHNFAASRTLYQQGGPRERICGARTRGGSPCRHIPIEGSSRCLRHAGPHAARAYRERQYAAFKLGRLSAADWNKAEAKRARNRLHDRWKKNPWLPGATIDLDEHEAEFLRDAGLTEHQAVGLPPAVVDWLRWRYQRLQIDRRRDEEWVRLLREELPRRLNRAGPRPNGKLGLTISDWTAGTGPWTQPVSRLSFKRQRQDRSKPIAKPKPASRVSLRAGNREAMPEIDARLVCENRELLACLLAKCEDDEERRAVVVALAVYVAAPHQKAAQDRWLRIVLTLRRR